MYLLAVPFCAIRDKRIEGLPRNRVLGRAGEERRQISDLGVRAGRRRNRRIAAPGDTSPSAITLGSVHATLATSAAPSDEPISTTPRAFCPLGFERMANRRVNVGQVLLGFEHAALGLAFTGGLEAPCPRRSNASTA